jgi:Kef-type K+ transport system membrane component KefB
VGKLVGCGLAARLTGYFWREAACIGTLMNTRGLMALIVVNVGKDVAIIPDSVYCMLILMALVTTIIATPVLIAVMPGTELEKPITASRRKTAIMAER